MISQGYSRAVSTNVAAPQVREPNATLHKFSVCQHAQLEALAELLLGLEERLQPILRHRVDVPDAPAVELTNVPLLDLFNELCESLERNLAMVRSIHDRLVI